MDGKEPSTEKANLLMNILVGGRGSGKTFELVQWLKEDLEHRTLVVHSVEMAKHICAHYDIPDSRRHPVRVISWSNYIAGTLRSDHDRQIAIDNLDLCLSWSAGYPSIVSFTGAVRTPREMKLVRELKNSVSDRQLADVTGEWYAS